MLDPTFAGRPIPTPAPPTMLSRRQHLRRLILRTIARLIPPSPLRPTTPPRRLLLIRPDHLGDLLFLTPALHALRQQWPEIQVTLLAGPWGTGVMHHNPYVNELWTCEFPGFTRRPKPTPWQPYRFLWREAQRVRRGQFDAALVLRFDHWWGAWLTAAAQIPQRIGYALPEVAPFLTTALPYQPARHEVEQNWALCAALLPASTASVTLGPLEFPVPAEAVAWAKEWLATHGLVAGRPLVIIHPGAGAAVKQWRSEQWQTLAGRLIADYGCAVVLTGGSDEAELCRQIAAGLTPPLPVAAGQTTLPQLAGLLAQAAVVVGPDTGPLKLAAAVGRPTVQLYGPVDAVKFGPWGDPSRHKVITAGLACQPCHRLDYAPADLPAHFCVAGLALPSVLAAVTLLLKTTI